MEVLRYKYIFLLMVLPLNYASSEEPTPNNKRSPKESTTICPFTKIIEDIFKVQNKTFNAEVNLKDSERAKLFLSSIANVTIDDNDPNTPAQEELVNDIIASINRIKNNITSDKNNDTKLNEAIILNVPIENSNRNGSVSDLNEVQKKNVGQIKSGVEDKVNQAKLQNSSDINEINAERNASHSINNNTDTSTEKTTYVEILTIEPNNTSINNTSSHNIIEVLKHLMPLFNSTLTKELHNITIIERNQNRNHSFSASKNVSTIIVTYCDKDNFTNVNLTSNSTDTGYKSMHEKNITDYDYLTENNSETFEENADDEETLTVGEKKDILEAAKYGVQKMHELYSVLEPKLYSMGLWLDDTNPARYVAAFNAPSEDAAKYSRYGYASLQAAAKLKQLTRSVVDEEVLIETPAKAIHNDQHEWNPFLKYDAHLTHFYVLKNGKF